MSRRGSIRRVVGPLLLVLATRGAVPAPARGQASPPPGALPIANPADAPPPGEVSYPMIPPGIQVVRLQPPPGAKVEVIAPPTEPIPAADPSVVGLRVGVSYQLRVSGLEGRPEAEAFPVVEVVGHVHRPPLVEPSRFPIRIPLQREDLEAAIDRGQLVTEVIYLEDPEQAVPLTLPKEEIPTATLTAAEDPVKVAAALGRVMAIVRIGSRTPGVEGAEGPNTLIGMSNVHCPFASPEGGHCPLPCGPVRGTAPPNDRAWLPRDEFLCDGGDRAEPMHFGGDGGLRGIDPRDALIRFRVQDQARPRILPTNVVCIYSPRFAAVRSSVGPIQAEMVQPALGVENLQRDTTRELTQGPRPLVRQEPPVIMRHRARASEAALNVVASTHGEVSILQGFDSLARAVPIKLAQLPATASNRQQAALIKGKVPPLTIKTAEGVVVTGIIQGANQRVMAWKPQELAAVETPPDRPGLAIIKRASAGVADSGDVITFVLQYRNMGNLPITSVSVIDSLVPRLEYLPRSAQGPAGTVFSASENKAGGTELRWDLPRALAPGQEGSVTFTARVR